MLYERVAIDIVTEILIAELHRNGLLDDAALQNMARRLTECGEGETADEVLGVVIGNALDDPGERRATLHAIDGGNHAD